MRVVPWCSTAAPASLRVTTSLIQLAAGTKRPDDPQRDRSKMCRLRAMATHRVWLSATSVGVLAILGIASAPARPQSRPIAAHRLELGKPLELKLDAAEAEGPAAALIELAVPADGPMTVDVTSHDDDVVLEQLAKDGSTITEVDEGGIGWNARMVVTAQSGDVLRLRARFKRLPAGHLEVLAQEGEVPLAEGFVLAEATANWRRRCGRAARDRGERDAAYEALLDAGQRSYHLGLYADSRLAFEDLLPLAEEGGNAWLQAVSQGYLGAIAVRFGEVAAGRDRLIIGRDGAIANRQASFELFCQANLGEAYTELGEFVAARTACERALLIARKTSDVPNEVDVLVLSAALAELEGDPDAARGQFAQAATLARELGQPDCLAEALFAHARFLRRRGEVEAADGILTETLGLHLLPTVQIAGTGELGNVRLIQGRWPEARRLFEQALESALDLGDEGLQAAALQSLAVSDWNAGDTVGCAEHLQAASKLLAERGTTGARISVLLLQSDLHSDAGRPDEARRALEAAIALAEGSSSPELVVLVLGHEVMLDATDPARLERGLLQAQRQLELARKADLAAGEAQALSGLAWLNLKLGRLEEAAAWSEQAVEAAGLVDPDRLAEALSTQLDVALARHDLPTSRRALAESRELLDRLPSQGINVDQLSMQRARWSFAQFAELEQDVVALSLSLEEDPDQRRALVDEGFRAVCRAQGRTLLEGIAEHRSGARDAETIGLRRQREALLADRSSALVALGSARREGAAPEQQELLRARAAGFAARLDSLSDELRRRSPIDAVIDATTDIEPGRVQRELLARGGSLVQYAEGQERLYAFLVTPSSIEWHDLGARVGIVELVQDVTTKMSDPSNLAPASQVAASGFAAWQALLAPLLPVDGHGRLTIVPTPELAALPFEALVTAPAADATDFSAVPFVIDRYEVSYGPSVPVLALLAATPPRSAPGRMLVLADAVVPGERLPSSSVPRRITESASWARLPGTRTEAMAIVDLLHGTLQRTEGAGTPPALTEERNGRLSTDRADVFVGGEASSARLTEEADRYAIVHLAAHGAVDATDPRRTGLVLAPADPQDDGFLSVAEVLDLDLDAELVVLSACDTARGPIRRGEGVQSLAWAFLYAGARGVVATLWQVDDRETEIVMRDFYRGLSQEQLGTATSLREARLRLRRAPAEAGSFVGTGRGELLPGAKKRRATSSSGSAGLRGHPYFWAPFISIGPAR